MRKKLFFDNGTGLINKTSIKKVVEKENGCDIHLEYPPITVPTKKSFSEMKEELEGFTVEFQPQTPPIHS